MPTLLALLSFAGAARAEPNERDRTLLLTVAAPAAEAEQLAAVARELLARLAMRVELRHVERIDVAELRRPPAADATYFARGWIAFAKTGKARLYLEQAARDRVLVRDVANEAHNPELVREELGHILQTAVEGLKAGEEIGAPRGEALKQVDDEQTELASPTPAPASPPRETAVTEPPPARHPRVRFGPRYELVWLGDGKPADGPGAVLGALLPGSARWGLELAGFFRRPLHVEAMPIGARLQSLAFDALLTFDAWQGPRARLRLAAGVQADLVRVTPSAAAGQGVELARSEWLKLALGRAALTYAHDVGRFMDLEVTLGVELAPGGTRYVLQRSSGTTDVFSPWPVRPLVSLGGTVP